MPVEVFSQQRKRKQKLVNSTIDYSIRHLTWADVGSIRALRSHVISSLSEPDMYVRESSEDDFLKRNLHAAHVGQSIGIFGKNELIAYGMVSYQNLNNTNNPFNLFHQIERDQDSCALMESAMVHPDYRCLGLHKLLLRLREKIAIQKGRRSFFAEGSLLNWVTRHNLFKAGYSIVNCCEMEDMRRRHLFFRSMVPRSFQGESRRQQHAVLVASRDFAEQRILIANGYVGVAPGNSICTIEYQPGFLKNRDPEHPGIASNENK